MWLTIVSSLLNCGDILFPGVPNGKARPRIMWIIFDWHTRCPQQLRQLTCGNGSHGGQYLGKRGAKPSSHMSPGYQRMCSGCGTPLIHYYHVFGRGGAHASLRGKFMLNMLAFAVWVEAEGRWERNRTTAQTSSLRVCSDLQSGVRRREPDDDSPRCKSRRAMFPSTSEVSADSMLSEDVSSPVPRSRLYKGRASLPPLTPNFVDNDFNSYTSVDFGRDTGVSGFSDISDFSLDVSRSGSYLIREFWVGQQCSSCWSGVDSRSGGSCDFSTFQ